MNIIKSLVIICVLLVCQMHSACNDQTLEQLQKQSQVARCFETLKAGYKEGCDIVCKLNQSIQFVVELDGEIERFSELHAKFSKKSMQDLIADLRKFLRDYKNLIEAEAEAFSDLGKYITKDWEDVPNPASLWKTADACRDPNKRKSSFNCERALHNVWQEFQALCCVQQLQQITLLCLEGEKGKDTSVSKEMAQKISVYKQKIIQAEKSSQDMSMSCFVVWNRAAFESGVITKKEWAQNLAHSLGCTLAK
ncbi:MAG: hypothetical protein OXC30_01165 [Alphaproteobacteria bacterium]|nr:hypothetical protein [Alphaproteobacteria bacterium]